MFKGVQILGRQNALKITRYVILQWKSIYILTELQVHRDLFSLFFKYQDCVVDIREKKKSLLFSDSFAQSEQLF